MKNIRGQFGIAVVTALLLALGGCGGGGGGGSPDPATTPAANVQQALVQAAAVPANDTSVNASAPFAVLQSAGVPAVTVDSPPKVNFAVFSDGALVRNVAITSVSVAIAKLVPGTNGNPDEWQNYTHRTRAAATGTNPSPAVQATLTNPALAQTTTAFTDPKQTDPTLLASQLVLNPDGYYTYTYRTDIKNPAQTNGVTFEPGLTHRVAVQLRYNNAAGETVVANPYFDFTFDANGKSVAVTDPSKTRKMTDVGSCNSCHEKLALHGGGRIDTQFCVLCHNPGTTDPNSGNVLTLSTMVHKLHAGRLLKSKLDAGQGGENYTVRSQNYTEVGFPQDLRNCTKCHSGDNPLTPQGDNWKTKPSKEACLTCHANKAGSAWETSHKVFAGTLVSAGAAAKDLTNAQCADCHRVGSAIAPERVHWNQNEENAAKYKMNIESAVYDATARAVTVKYSLTDPTNGDAPYNLATPDCTGGGATFTCASTTRFGNLRLYLAYQNMVGQPTAVSEWSGGSGVNVFAYRGTNDGTNRYTIQVPVPADTATAVAAGSARIVTIGQIKEPKLQVKSATDPRPEAVPRELVNTVVKHTFKDFAISGPVIPRREIVANDKCNACHGALGTTSGSNTLANAFHGGARNTVEACVMCHDVNRMSSTIMTNGLALNESYQFKRMIHGIHGNSKRTYPFTHGNKVVGAFNKNGTSATGGSPLASDVLNFAAEVAWPGVGINCNACHVNNSYKVDQGPLGAVISKPAGVTNPMQWQVISPKAATCTACHDSPTAMAHVTSFGNASFGNRTQAQSIQTLEICADCHSSGGFKGVDIVHGQK